MRELFIPFNSKTEADVWIRENCEQCNKSRCYGRTALHMYTKIGHLTLSTARKIGTTAEEEISGVWRGRFRYICKMFKPFKKTKRNTQTKLF